MAQLLKPDDPRSPPENHVVEGEGENGSPVNCPLTFTCLLWYACDPLHPPNYTQSECSEKLAATKKTTMKAWNSSSDI